MRIIQLVPSISDEASGPSYSVPALCQALVMAGAEVELHVLTGDSPPAARYTSFAHGEWAWPRRLHISPRLKRALIDAALRADILHNHSLWAMANVYPGQVIPQSGSRCLLMTSPEGTLAAWALRRGRWRKRLMWWLCQARTLRHSACLHATGETEYVAIREAGLKTPVALIPNGIDVLPEKTPAGSLRRPRRLLFLGRIHPVKGVDLLLQGWRAVQNQFPDWELHVVGPGDSAYLRHIHRLGHELGVERVRFPGPAYGEAKSTAYREADLFVLPTHTESFGMTVAEALAHGLPAIVSRNAPWSGLETQGCGWWIEFGTGPLIECLRHAMAQPSAELRRRGSLGRVWMKRDFSWNRIGEMMRDTYHWLLAGGASPEWVRSTSGKRSQRLNRYSIASR